MHDEVERLVRVGAELLLGVGLVLAEALRLQGDVAGFIDTVDVAKGGGDGEHFANGREGLVDGVDLLGRRVELFGIDGLVVDAVLLTAGDADLHLEPDVHLDEALKVLFANGNVFLVGFFRQIKHVAAEERFAVLRVEFLVGAHHAVEPREELLGAVVRVQDDGDAVVGRDGAHMQRQRH